MKKKTNKRLKAKDSMNRYFMIAKVFLAVTPVICYFYVSLLSMKEGIGMQDVLTQHPSVTILFLIAMINPYIAYLMHLVQKKLESNDTTFALINMGLLLLAQIFTMNALYFMMLLFVFYKAVCVYHIEVKTTCRSMNLKQSLWNGGGSLFVVMISTLCLFATIRLM